MDREMNIPKLRDLERILIEEGSEYEQWVWRIKGTGIIHHPTRPAMQHKNGNWAWYWMDYIHRWDGPSRYINGKHEWWIYGRELSKDKWLRDPRRLEWLRNQTERI